MQVDPIKPKLKPPGTSCLKLMSGVFAINFCFQIQLAQLHGGE